MNNREIKRMMAQMGIKSTEFPDVTTVILKGRDKDYVITEAQVMMIEAQGQKSFQITGNFKEAPKGAQAPQPQDQTLNEEDIKLVMEQASVTREKAVAALKKSNGEPAKAILSLLEHGSN
ncbi:MAG TPA: nascent polypeptide-associated complex protein [Thermoplasmataceae archaeon]|nr:nascent polypeptide-associated complex protein [Thermoplasmataceae archaeon]